MKKSKLITVSAAVLLLSVQSAAAQVCTVPPTCDALGYTKSAADCSGKTILKCPLDQTKVYCPGYEETQRIYKVGDDYIDSNGLSIGTVVKIDETGRHGVVVTSRGGATADEASEACLSFNAGGLMWSLAEGKYACKVKGSDNGDSPGDGYYYVDGCKVCYVRTASGPGCCPKNTFKVGMASSQAITCSPSQSLAIYCQALF